MGRPVVRALPLAVFFAMGVVMSAGGMAWAQAIPVAPEAPAAPPEVAPVPPEGAPPPPPAPDTNAPPEALPPPPPPPAPPPPEAALPQETAVVAAPAVAVKRPRLSTAIGMGASYDPVGFSDGDAHAIPAFFAVLGIGDRLFGLDVSAFASSARRSDRASQSPVDRLGVDAFGVLRPGARYRPDDFSYQARVLRALAAEVGLGFERDGRSAISGTRFLVHLGGRVDLPLTPATEPTELRLRLAARRGLGLYSPKLYASGDVTSVGDTSGELYAALVVVF